MAVFGQVPQSNGFEIGAITVPTNYTDQSGLHLNAKAKLKLKRTSTKAVVQYAQPGMQTDPKYAKLYEDTFQECLEKFGGSGLRRVGYEAYRLSQRRIREIEKKEKIQQKRAKAMAQQQKQATRQPPQATAERSRRATVAKPAVAARPKPLPLDDEHELDEIFAGLAQPAEDAAEPLTDWEEVDLQELETMRHIDRKVLAQASRSKPPADDEDAGWAGVRAAGAIDASERDVPMPNDFMGIPRLRQKPEKPQIYIEFAAVERVIRMRAHWALMDDAKSAWICFVVDLRWPGIENVKDYFEGLAEGVAELRYSDTVAGVAQAEVVNVISIVNTIQFGQFQFVQIFFTDD